MNSRTVLVGDLRVFALTFAGILSCWAAAQEKIASVRSIADGPDPREVPVPPIKTALGKLSGPRELPTRKEMPDVLTMDDGTKVTTPEQWKHRREEMKRILAYYAVGEMPPPPGNVVGREVKSEVVADGKV